MMAMNGVVPQAAQPLNDQTPVAYMQPFVITPASIRWIVGGAIAAIWSLYTADFIYRPAKATDLETLTKVVQVIQTGQAETAKAVERLTLAVDNLSGIVADIRAQRAAAAAAVKIPAPRVNRP